MSISNGMKIFILFLLAPFAVYSQTLTTAGECQECHASAFAEWRTSRHANSSRDGNAFYAAMLHKAEKSGKMSSQFECQRCHAPSKFLSGQSAIKEGLEGITCEVCHASRIVHENHSFQFKRVDGNVKFGPIKDAVSSAHECKYNENLENSSFCLMCHSDAKTAHGILFCSTEEEWKQSSYAQNGVTCQDCHMPATEGKAAPLGKIRDEIHSHAFYGGYSQEFLRNCATIELKAKREAGMVNVTVKIKNETVGHALPTGSPMRMVILKLEARNEQQQPVWKNWYVNPLKEDTSAVFMRLLQDGNGRAPVPPWEASSVKFDQRIKPDETRVLHYEFPDSTAKTLHAKLTYRLAPPPLLKNLGIEDEIYTKAKVITETAISF